MITAAVTGAQARKLNYVEVEIVPKPSTGKHKGDRPLMLIGDAGVTYTTIIFPDRDKQDKKGTPRNSLDADQLQLSGGHVSFKDVPLSSLQKNVKDEVKLTPPRRRRAHSSPSGPRDQSIPPPIQRHDSKEGRNDDEKCRTLPKTDPPWPEKTSRKEEPRYLKREENPNRALVAVDKGKQETTARKVKKFFRSGRQASDLGENQDILQAVQAMKKVRRKSSGESVDSGNDPGYPSSVREPPEPPKGHLKSTHEGDCTTPNTVRNPPPIPGCIRNTELEKAMTRRKLARQSSLDQSKALVAAVGSEGKEVVEVKNPKKLRYILPSMKFGKFGSKSKEAKLEEKNQQCKKPVPLPRYQRGQMGYDLSFDDGFNEPTVHRDTEQTASSQEGEMYVNVVFQKPPSRGDRHDYENVSLDDAGTAEKRLRHGPNPPESGPHQLRPMPAPRMKAPPLKMSPPGKPLGRKTSSENGYEPVTFKQPCLKVVATESFFPQHVGSSFEDDDAGLHSSCDEDVTLMMNNDMDHLTHNFKKDAIVSSSRELKRGFRNVVFKRNSDGSVRSMPENWDGNQYATTRMPATPEDPDTGCRPHQKGHNRSHSSGGQRAPPIYAGVNKTPIVLSSPPRQRREKRTPRPTHEQVTLENNVHPAIHSPSTQFPTKPYQLAICQEPNPAHAMGHQGSGAVDEIKAKYKEEGTPRTPPTGSPRLIPRAPWWDDDAEDEQLEEKPLHTYINQPWYYGKLLRQECDYLMLSKGKSCQYLVRDSSHRAGGLMLCVLYGQKVHHYIIQVVSNNDYQMANHNFSSVSEIIEFYRKHIIMYSPNQEPVFLGEPFLYPR